MSVDVKRSTIFDKPIKLNWFSSERDQSTDRPSACMFWYWYVHKCVKWFCFRVFLYMWTTAAHTSCRHCRCCCCRRRWSGLIEWKRKKNELTELKHNTHTHRNREREKDSKNNSLSRCVCKRAWALPSPTIDVYKYSCVCVCLCVSSVSVNWVIETITSRSHTCVSRVWIGSCDWH